MRRTVLLLLVCYIAFTVAGSAMAMADKTRIKVVASTTQIADFARQIMGDTAEVVSILAPGADPHTYQPTPDDVQIVLQADICIENGIHLEGKSWMATLAKDAEKPLITATTGLQPLEIGDDDQKVLDPHAWFSPKNVALYVNNITKAMAGYYPDYKAEYQARSKLYLQQLRVLDAWIREQVNRIPPQRRILVTTHDAFNYFCREYKFNASNDFLSIAPVGWSTGAEVGAGITPERRKMVVKSIKESGSPAIFVETTINPKQIREIAQETGVAIGGELYSDSMGPKGSAGETYIGMMRENVLLIVNALK
ncbi:metal ABC transporter solute-binding protein, Zn/Mn family [Desulfosediminicola flagellatus]|uniref:metal ABC transporter solute-binding protein, Zn/Mn family n=1 Tax=Desulfosediminicola flagellatus TaxID=2569541 RepID=UPI0010AD45CD|nr:zinc ABC transporter substrate-binding protein [Desulfosediminicola flagellatus]